MGYVKAEHVLPDDLIKLIQEYVNGEFIYIPRKEGCQKAWGEKSGLRENICERNRLIYRKYTQGMSIYELSREHFLSEHSIRRIICNEKRYMQG